VSRAGVSLRNTANERPPVMQAPRRRSLCVLSGLAGLALRPGLVSATFAAPDATLWPALARGGHVVLMRHALTEPGIGDPPGFLLSDCATQRNLSEVGRGQASAIGAAFARYRVPVGRVLSSRWCRCLDTARLAFGRVESHPPLDSFFADRSREADAAVALRALTATRPNDGNLVLVTHQVNITAFTGEVPAMGEWLVITPGRGAAGTHRVLGRMRVASESRGS